MKVRIISAIVAIAIVLPFIIMGGYPYAFGVGVLAIGGFVEIIKLKKSHHELPFISCLIALLSLLLITFANVNGNYFNIIDYKLLIFCTLSLLIPTIFKSDSVYTTSDAFYLMGCVLFLGIAFGNFITIRYLGLPIFCYLVLIPICTDTFALIGGLKFGKHKMTKISPKKTWEGALTGLIFGTILPCIFYAFVVHNINIKIIFGTIILSTMGQIGDLIFSKIKRENDIKDFSKIMPGHGGILDRLDSTIIIFMTYMLLKTLLF